ncbi:MAG: dienelactone hydrolase family protein [Woeseiaceae bacterium]|nr:dienelactone hydrolase family protein [Woeseiaceae bacterium]
MPLHAFSRLRNVAVPLVAAMFLVGCGNGGDAGDTAVDSAAGNATASSRMPRSAELNRAVDAETLPYAEVGEELVYGHFAFPSDMIEPLPAIILLHDWWGLNDDMRAAASRLAAEGYMVLAVDLYSGESVDHIEDARRKMISVLENPDDVEANLNQALDFVQGVGAPSVATLGWGLGGTWSLSSTMLFADRVDAAVVFYGQLVDDTDQLEAIQAPILSFYGAGDRVIRADSVRDFESTMRGLRKELTVKFYDDAGHAFADPARPNNFRPELAEDAWNRTVAFLQANLALTDES